MACVNHPSITEQLTKCDGCGQEFCRNCIVSFQSRWLCARCKSGAVSDVKAGLNPAQAELASIGKRFGAVFIDGMITGIPGMMLGGALATYMISGGEETMKAMAAEGPFGAVNIISGLVGGIIGFVYEGVQLKKNGQTIGKKALKIKVVNADGSSISGATGWKRAALRAAFNILSLPILIDYAMGVFSKEKVTLRDRLCNTRVVSAV